MLDRAQHQGSLLIAGLHQMVERRYHETFGQIPTSAEKIIKVTDCDWQPRGAFDAVSIPMDEGVVTVAIN